MIDIELDAARVAGVRQLVFDVPAQRVDRLVRVDVRRLVLTHRIDADVREADDPTSCAACRAWSSPEARRPAAVVDEVRGQLVLVVRSHLAIHREALEQALEMVRPLAVVLVFVEAARLRRSSIFSASSQEISPPAWLHRAA
jgi:hypothetical protein